MDDIKPADAPPEPQPDQPKLKTVQVMREVLLRYNPPEHDDNKKEAEPCPEVR